MLTAIDEHWDTAEEFITDDDIRRFCNTHGYFCIKINNLADWQKLEQFVTSEIYPLVHDQESFLYANPF